MSDWTSNDALALTLARKDRELRLLLALDDIRDSASDDDDPRAMLTTIVHLLLEHFKAAACALALLEETSDEFAFFAFEGIDEALTPDLCRAALSHTQPTTLTNSAHPHNLGMRLAVRDLPLGAIYIGRSNRPFDQEERALLRIAARQIDSAVLQAHTIWKLIQRTRELDAIYRIDSLRDNLSSEDDLLRAFVSVLIEEYKAEAAFVLTSTTDAIASAEVRDDLAQAVEALRSETAHLQFPQVIPMQQGLTTHRNAGTPMTLLAAPFLVAGERLGAVIVGREKPFSIADHRLLFAMNSQMDSAVVYLRLVERLAQAEALLASTKSKLG
jgi:hypothetical protein